MALKALLFDCDGVIAETESDGHRVAFNETFKAEGIDAEWGVEEYGRLVEIGGGKERMKYYFRQSPEKYPPNKFDDAYIAQLHKLKTARFMQLCPTLPARPGVRRIMLAAADAGLRVFICSTSNEKSVGAIANAVLGDDKARVITAIYAGDMVKAKKPAPDIYQMVVENHPLRPEECLVVEDTRIGLQAALAAGMRCLVTQSMYSRADDFTGAAAVVESLGETDVPCRPQSGLAPDTPCVTLDILRGLVE